MKENQLPTAEEYISTDSKYLSKKDTIKSMIEFAKLHVTEALNEVYLQNEEILSKEIVMNAYSLDKIQ